MTDKYLGIKPSPYPRAPSISFINEYESSLCSCCGATLFDEEADFYGIFLDPYGKVQSGTSIPEGANLDTVEIDGATINVITVTDEEVALKLGALVNDGYRDDDYDDDF